MMNMEKKKKKKNSKEDIDICLIEKHIERAKQDGTFSPLTSILIVCSCKKCKPWNYKEE